MVPHDEIQRLIHKILINYNNLIFNIYYCFQILNHKKNIIVFLYINKK